MNHINPNETDVIIKQNMRACETSNVEQEKKGEEMKTGACELCQDVGIRILLCM